jgi:hypothetical protein
MVKNCCVRLTFIGKIVFVPVSVAFIRFTAWGEKNQDKHLYGYGVQDNFGYLILICIGVPAKKCFRNVYDSSVKNASFVNCSISFYFKNKIIKDIALSK